MKTTYYSTVLIAALGTFALMLTSCDVDVVEKGEMPEVEVKGGKLPKVDVEGPDVHVGVKEVEVEVPKVKTETETITVPVIGVDLPNDDDEKTPPTTNE